MKPDDRVRLRHMVDALNSTIRFTVGRRRDDLDKDEMLAFALVHALQIVGEAASKDRHRHARAKSADSMGHYHRHAASPGSSYVDIGLDIVWTTATEAAPALLAQVKPLLDPD